MPREWLAAASASGAVGLVFVVDDDLGPYVSDWQDAEGSIYDLDDVEPNVPAVLVSAEALDASIEGLDIGTTLASANVIDTGARIELSADLSVQTLTAPNVVGVLPGSDPDLQDEYVLISAHMDGLGVGGAVDGDSIYNGADDNASGTSALIEVAEAMAVLGEGPRRSVIFLAVSGEEIGLLGSTWFVAHSPVPLENIVANINIDMVGRNWQDTIAVIGKQYSTLGATIDSVAAAHPELNMTPVGDQWPAEGFFFRSDHYNFARKGIPAVFFFNGTHEDYHRPSDEADRIEYGKAARISRLIYEVALTLANADERPRWDSAARERIVEPGF
jgi:Zn-dependent M28 family amino/carboxypeptidase